MRKFIKKVAKFTVLLIIILLILQFIVDKGLKNNYTGFYYVWNTVYNGKVNSDIIVLGSSRAKKQFIPNVIEKKTGLSTFNLGLDGANIHIQQSIWNAFIENNRNPKLVILEIEEMRLQKDKNIFNKEQFLPYMTRGEVYSALKFIRGFSYADLVIPFYKYHAYENIFFKGIKSFFIIQDDSALQSNRGFEPLHGTLADTLSKKINVSIDTSEVRNSLQLVKSFYKTLRSKGINFLVVKTPKYKGGEFLVSNEYAIKKMLDEFLFDNNILCIDFSGNEFPNNPSLFFDAEHLNDKGALLFTEMFSKQLIARHLL